MPAFIIVGDSHTAALSAGLRDYIPPPDVSFAVHRVMRPKKNKTIGDTPFEDCLRITSDSPPDSIIVSALGGSQYAVTGLIQHEQPFDFFADADADEAELIPDATIVPHAAIRDMCETALRRGDLSRLKQLQSAAGARPVLHLAVPPPKEHVMEVLDRPGGYWKDAGIREKGISPPSLQHKLWALQNEVWGALCAECGATFLPVPKAALSETGFLARACYGPDAVHGNAAYGRLVLSQIAALVPAASYAPPAAAASRCAPDRAPGPPD